MREIQINLGSKHPINPKEYVNTQTDTHAHTNTLYSHTYIHFAGETYQGIRIRVSLFLLQDTYQINKPGGPIEA